MLENLINVGLGIAELAVLIAIAAIVSRRLPNLRTIALVLGALFVAHAALFVVPSHLLHLPGTWNWYGKVLSILVTLACIALIPGVGWTDAGFTWKQNGGATAAIVGIVLACAFQWGSHVLFAGVHFKMPNAETLAYQATMPGLNEEPLYRGLALLLIDRAFGGPVWNVLGAPFGWGAVITSLWFGLIHGNGIANGHFAIDPITIALVAVMGFFLAWIRMRTGSIALGVVSHNLGNVGDQFL